jgi:hypothetical protein
MAQPYAAPSHTMLAKAGDRVGLSATATNAIRGFETFFVANLPTVAAIPEPETYALMMAGFGVVGFVASRRKR